MNRRDTTVLAGLWGAAALCAVLGYASHPRASHYVPSARDPQGLRVLTWNLGDQDTHALNDDHITHVAHIFHELDADIICVQEVESHEQFDELLRAMGHSHEGRLTRNDNRRVGVLCRGSLNWEQIPIPGGRPALRADLALDRRRTVRLAVVHADAFSAEQRNNDIGRVVDALLDGADHVPSILAGDLNLDLDLDKRRDLFSHNAHLDIESYNYITNHFFDTGIGRGTTAEPDRRLDYIFTDARFGVVGAGPVKGKRTGNMDHDPVVADLVFVD
jgi:endonuclease/exonuclease/phosphatase family metal-dependent hydrolase